MTKLRYLYELLGVLSTEAQSHLCRDFGRTLDKSKTVPPLVSWFTESLETLAGNERIDAPFLGPAVNKTRKPLGHNVIGTNRVVHLLQKENEIRVVDAEGQDSYRFRYVERELPPLRSPGVRRPHSGSGGIDYVALRLSGEREQPCLGEIKVKADQNAFYAFIQLLTYLSELGTRSQIERINEHTLFGKEVGPSPAFDLHILLANFRPDGRRADLTNETQKLAKKLQRSAPEV